MKKLGQEIALLGALIVLFPAVSEAWEEEVLKGTYSLEGRNLSIRFEWRADGIEKLRINGHPYPKAKYDNLGVFGNSALIRICAEERPDTLKAIDLLIFVNGRQPLVASGYYVDIHGISDDGSFKTVLAVPLTMRYKPLRATRGSD